MSFLTTLFAITGNAPVIPEFLSGLYFKPENDNPVSVQPPEPVIKCVLRLQTLIGHEMKRSELPIEALPGELGVHAYARVASINQDGTARMVMLDRLITEVVHDAVPTEYEFLGRRYRVNVKRQLQWEEPIERGTTF